MRLAKVVTILGAAVMAAVLLNGFIRGDIAEEGRVLLGMPWGLVSFVDLYVGFLLFSGWIVFRERSLWRSLLWVISVMVLGFFAASLYGFVALQTSGGDWGRFWMGRRLSQA